jgi:uncharacterized protein YbaA (DUF1428 family)
MLPVSLDCPFLIALSAFANVYIMTHYGQLGGRSMALDATFNNISVRSWWQITVKHQTEATYETIMAFVGIYPNAYL